MNSITTEIIKKYASQFHNEVIDIRRHIHKNPELSGCEFKTAEYISDYLRKLDIPYTTLLSGNAISAIIKGKNPDKKTIALRADLDALPIEETNDVSYKSIVPGVMHACGHDVHIASLLGTAKILSLLKDDFEGSVKLFFQPHEEAFPGGAKPMIDAGVLENPSPSSVIAQHVMPELEVGKIGVKGGRYMASSDEIFLTVVGVGGHAATPDRVIDPVLISAHIITALQQIVSRNAFPGMPSVVSFGKLIAAGRNNVIPEKVTIDGTVRTFDEKWRDEIHKKITDISQSIARSMGGDCLVKIIRSYPSLINDEELAKRIFDFSIDYLGEENVINIDIQMTAEDFSYFAKERPSCLFRLGTGNQEKGITAGVHRPGFDIDEDALKTSIGLMTWLAINELKI